MNEPSTNNDPPIKPDGKVASEGNADTNPAAGEQTPQLTKEEQWALFEKELKESDWGHQPC